MEASVSDIIQHFSIISLPDIVFLLGMGMQHKPRSFNTVVDSVLWTPKIYIYITCEIVLSLGFGLLLRSPFLLYALDAALFFPVFVAHIDRWEITRLFKIANFWGIIKSVVFVICMLLTGNQVDVLVSQGLSYHQDTLNWILYDEGIIGHPEQFLPLHLIGIWRVVTSAMGSCGLTTLIGGSRELNIMNFHVAKLLQMSTQPLCILLFGWPIWSLIRGWAYLALMVGCADVFLVIVRRHKWHWQRIKPYVFWGLVGSVVDAGLKIALAPFWGSSALFVKSSPYANTRARSKSNLARPYI